MVILFIWTCGKADRQAAVQADRQAAVQADICVTSV